MSSRRRCRSSGCLLSCSCSGRSRRRRRAKEYAAIITRESERLSRLIDNVLDFSRIERGKAAYEMKPGDLGEVVERALDFTATDWSARVASRGGRAGGAADDAAR